ncbi:hypothetical protein L207DRAFT_576886 [Hyaloscypha variabilis F]|uniref:DDH domain-containing protein n=1 Tax=Hyaloscypha variabilis (strain UAMH 11265 / GT02V1 / F) TaxID=1149755 RepID=A0A2J6S5H9_HYAVF|nr:hypothetical protein L207DRAFT_576886 [Hyaloscypha variabilis F]
MAFYDETLGLYIYTTPLTVSSQVLEAADELGITLKWDSKGYVCRISHEAAMGLSKKLGLETLSVSQFMDLASRRPEVASPNFAEWLSDTYTIDSNGVCYDHSGDIVDLPRGRPGWFLLEDVNKEGYPIKINDQNSLGLWKYWSPNIIDPGVKCGAMRSFVTSSGTCSLDLGIPADARHLMVMIRGCYPALKAKDVSPIESIWNDYLSVTGRKDEAEIRRFITSQNIESLALGSNFNKLLNERDQERGFDLLGKKRILLGNYEGLQTITISDIHEILSGKPAKSTTYVVGHEHPDADSVVSSIFEALRRNLIYSDQNCLPWAPSIPHEILSIISPKIAGMMLKVPECSEYHRLTLVDCHHCDGVNDSQIKGVIDHHRVTKQFPAYVALSNESSWSTTLQIYIKIIGSGFDLDPETSRILAEATLLEAEPQLMTRRPKIDRLALERLKTVAGPSVRDYGALLNLMMVETGPSALFYKDYR